MIERSSRPDKDRSAAEPPFHALQQGPAAAPSPEIPPKLLQKLQVIAQRVGGETTSSGFSMDIVVGPPGCGSQFIPGRNLMILDPIQVLADPELAQFIAAHEGGHRAITLGPKELGLTEARTNELFGQLGFAYLQNVMEDGADNNWVRSIFAGLGPLITAHYDKQFSGPDACMHTPETVKLMRELGYVPRLVRFGTEVLRDWHTGAYRKGADEAVDRALDRTIGHLRTAVITIPLPGRRGQAVIDAGRARFDRVTERVWPEVQKLMQLDLGDAAERRLASDLTKQQQLEQEIKQAGKKGGKKDAQGLEDKLKELRKRLGDGFPGVTPQELEKALNDLDQKSGEEIREQAGRIAAELKKGEKQRRAAAKKQQELERQIKELERQMQGKRGSPEQREELDRLRQEKAAAEAKEQQAGAEMKAQLEGLKAKSGGLNGPDLEKQIEQMLRDEYGRSGSRPVPLDKLSPETRKTLKKIFETLPSETRKTLAEEGRRDLENLEDALNDELKPKLAREEAPTHAELHAEREAAEEARQHAAEAAARNLAVQKALKDARLKGMSPWERVFTEVAERVNDAYARLEPVLNRREHPDYEPGHPHGLRPNLGMAMQAQADPRLFSQIWERRGIPTERGYAFVILVDRSVSMKDGSKDKHSFRGVVAGSELLERLEIPFEVLGVGDNLYRLKSYDHKLADESTRKRLCALRRALEEGTDDAKGVRASYRRVLSRPEAGKFIIVISDAASGAGRDLREIVKRVRGEQQAVLLHFGLGPGTKDKQGYYDHSFGNLRVKVSEEKRAQGVRDFCDVFCDVIEDIVHHPEKYLSGKAEKLREERIALAEARLAAAKPDAAPKARRPKKQS